MRTSSLDSNTSKDEGTLVFPMVSGMLDTIPKDLVLAPLAVTTINLDGLLMSKFNFFKSGVVTIFVAAPLSTTAVCAFPLILSVIFAAVVVSSSSSLVAKFASLSLCLL